MNFDFGVADSPMNHRDVVRAHMREPGPVPVQRLQHEPMVLPHRHANVAPLQAAPPPPPPALTRIHSSVGAKRPPPPDTAHIVAHDEGNDEDNYNDAAHNATSSKRVRIDEPVSIDSHHTNNTNIVRQTTLPREIVAFAFPDLDSTQISTAQLSTPNTTFERPIMDSIQTQMTDIRTATLNRVDETITRSVEAMGVGVVSRIGIANDTLALKLTSHISHCVYDVSQDTEERTIRIVETKLLPYVAEDSKILCGAIHQHGTHFTDKLSMICNEMAKMSAELHSLRTAQQQEEPTSSSSGTTAELIQCRKELQEEREKTAALTVSNNKLKQSVNALSAQLTA
jgi:hypothetical protein